MIYQVPTQGISIFKRISRVNIFSCIATREILRLCIYTEYDENFILVQLTKGILFVQN
jgi:hypothetical protein